MGRIRARRLTGIPDADNSHLTWFQCNMRDGRVVWVPETITETFSLYRVNGFFVLNPDAGVANFVEFTGLAGSAYNAGTPLEITFGGKQMLMFSSRYGGAPGVLTGSRIILDPDTGVCLPMTEKDGYSVWEWLDVGGDKLIGRRNTYALQLEIPASNYLADSENVWTQPEYIDLDNDDIQISATPAYVSSRGRYEWFALSTFRGGGYSGAVDLRQPISSALMQYYNNSGFTTTNVNYYSGLRGAVSKLYWAEGTPYMFAVCLGYADNTTSTAPNQITSLVTVNIETLDVRFQILGESFYFRYFSQNWGVHSDGRGIIYDQNLGRVYINASRAYPTNNENGPIHFVPASSGDHDIQYNPDAFAVGPWNFTGNSTIYQNNDFSKAVRISNNGEDVSHRTGSHSWGRAHSIVDHNYGHMLMQANDEGNYSPMAWSSDYKYFYTVALARITNIEWDGVYVYRFPLTADEGWRIGSIR